MFGEGLRFQNCLVQKLADLKVFKHANWQTDWPDKNMEWEDLGWCLLWNIWSLMHHKRGKSKCGLISFNFHGTNAWSANILTRSTNSNLTDLLSVSDKHVLSVNNDNVSVSLSVDQPFQRDKKENLPKTELLGSGCDWMHEDDNSSRQFDQNINANESDSSYVSRSPQVLLTEENSYNNGMTNVWWVSNTEWCK